MNPRQAGRLTRHRRIRKRVAGFSQRPRLSVFRSHKHLYAQLINDMENATILGVSTLAKPVRQHNKQGGNITAAQQLGKLVALEAIKRGIKHVVFDRGGYHYHGRVKALADAAREAGLVF